MRISDGRHRASHHHASHHRRHASHSHRRRESHLHWRRAEWERCGGRSSYAEQSKIAERNKSEAPKCSCDLKARYRCGAPNSCDWARSSCPANGHYKTAEYKSGCRRCRWMLAGSRNCCALTLRNSFPWSCRGRRPRAGDPWESCGRIACWTAEYCRNPAGRVRNPWSCPGRSRCASWAGPRCYSERIAAEHCCKRCSS